MKWEKALSLLVVFVDLQSSGDSSFSSWDGELLSKNARRR